MGWPGERACRRVALAVFGLAFALYLSAGVLAASLGLGLRPTVIVSQLVALLGLSLWLVRRLDLGVAEALALRPATPLHFVLAVAVALPLQIAGGVLQYYILELWPQDAWMRAQLEESMRQLVEIRSPSDWAVLFLAGVVVAAVCEEIFFRGLLLRLLARREGWPRAIVIGALLFSAFHLDPVGFVPRVLVGAWFGLLVWRSGSLLPAMLAHAANNSMALLGAARASETSVPDGDVAIAGIVYGAVALAMIGVYARVTRPHPGLQEPTASPAPDLDRASGS